MTIELKSKGSISTLSDVDLTGLLDKYVLYYDATSGKWKVEALPAAAPHNILSTTHSDTLVDSIIAGDLLIGNNTPKLARLAKSTDGKVLTLVSGLPAWADPTGGLVAHQLDGPYHTVSGLTPGHFLKALTATTFGFAAHGLSYGDVGAAASDHTHAQLHDRSHDVESSSDHSASSKKGLFLKTNPSTGAIEVVAHGLGYGDVGADASGAAATAESNAIAAIATDTNLSADAQDAVSKRHSRSHLITGTSDHDPTGLTASQLIRLNAGATAIESSGKVVGDFEASGAVATHAGLTTGVHGVGAGTVAKVADIAADGNLSAAAQDAISKRHAQSHAITSTADHTSTSTAGKIQKADANGLPVDATNTDSDVSDAVSKKHTRSHTIVGTSDHDPAGLTASQLLRLNAGATAIESSGKVVTDFEAAGAVATHAALATGVHNVGGSTVESASGSQSKVDTHAALTTGVHGVGAGTVAKVADIAMDTNLSAAAQDAVSKRHSQAHAITSTSDHTSAATAGKMLKADANGLPSEATNTDTDVADAVTKKHTQGSDTTLGSMASDVNMNSHKLTGLSVPASNGDSVRATTKITEAALEDAVDKKHTCSHSLVSTSDHTSAVPVNKHFKADANGLPVEATNTDAEIAAAVTASHARGHSIVQALDHTDWPSGLTAAELAYVHGVTSAIQTQLNAKATPAQALTMLVWGAYEAQNSATTGYCSIAGGAKSGSEAVVQVRCGKAGTLQRLRFCNNQNTLNGNTVVTVRKNGANTDVTLTVAGGAGDAWYTDDVHSVAVAVDDLLDYSIVTAGSSGAIVLRLIQCEIL